MSEAPDSFMARFGAKIVDNGYAVIPIAPGTKKPGRFKRGEWRDYPGWTRHGTRETTLNEAEIWSAWPDCAIGIACGNVVAIDIDLLDGVLANEIEQLARNTPLLRIGRAPKRLLVYRAETPFSDLRRAPLEVLGQGRQFVAFAVHPATGRPYEWPEESPLDVPFDRLPVITEEQARRWLEDAHALLPEELKQTALASSESSATSFALAGTHEAIASALATVPNADLDYDSWVRIGVALKGALGEDAHDLFAAWSAQSAKNVEKTTAKAWASFRPTHIGAGTIYHHALSRGWTPDPSLMLDGTAPQSGEHRRRNCSASSSGANILQQSSSPRASGFLRPAASSARWPPT